MHREELLVLSPRIACVVVVVVAVVVVLDEPPESKIISLTCARHVRKWVKDTRRTSLSSFVVWHLH